LFTIFKKVFWLQTLRLRRRPTKQDVKQRRAKECQVLSLALVELMGHAEQLLLCLVPVASDDDFEQVRNQRTIP